MDGGSHRSAVVECAAPGFDHWANTMYSRLPPSPSPDILATARKSFRPPTTSIPGALIIINGFPGVGKHTVGKELIKILPNCHFVDIRHVNATASQLYAVDDPAHGRLRKSLIRNVLESLQAESFIESDMDDRSGQPQTYVFTEFLSINSRGSDDDLMAEFISFSQRSGFAFIHAILTCSPEANVERLTCTKRLRERDQLEGSGGGGGDSASDTDTAAGVASLGATLASTILTDEHTLIEMRMEEEVSRLGPLKGLSGEYELETSNLDAHTAAGILAEHYLDTLRSEGWWVQLNRGMRGVSTSTEHRRTCPEHIGVYSETTKGKGQGKGKGKAKDGIANVPPSPSPMSIPSTPSKSIAHCPPSGSALSVASATSATSTTSAVSATSTKSTTSTTSTSSTWSGFRYMEKAGMTVFGSLSSLNVGLAVPGFPGVLAHSAASPSALSAPSVVHSSSPVSYQFPVPPSGAGAGISEGTRNSVGKGIIEGLDKGQSDSVGKGIIKGPFGPSRSQDARGVGVLSGSGVPSSGRQPTWSPRKGSMRP